jgi:Gram-negative bacterial TonB protein C-terminal
VIAPRWRLAVAFAATLAAPAANAQPAGGDDPPLALYREPAFAQPPKAPVYPTAAARLGQEGWVELNFMVDTAGKPYEIYASDHVGNEAFVDSAIRALGASELTPASIGSQAVHGSKRMLYRFILDNGPKGARRNFVYRYRQFTKAAADGAARDELEQSLRDLEQTDVYNNYEYAYMSLARYFYALSYGTPLEQMQHLKKALGESLAQPDIETFLGEDALIPRRSLFQLQARTAHYGEALETLELMRRKGDDEGAELFRETAEQLISLQANDVPYRVAGLVAEDGSWEIKLLKDGFYFDDLAGTVAQLKLRCQRDYVSFAFEPDTQYNVSARAGDCWLEVLGDAGTTFALVQN